MNVFSKLKNSSTFWVSLILPALQLVVQHFLGITIPWEAVASGVGAYGLKEAAAKVTVKAAP